MNKKVLFIVLAAVIAGAGIFWAIRNNNTKQNNQLPEQSSGRSSEQSTSDKSVDPNGSAIAFDGTGFTPKNLTVTAGTEVQIMNNSNSALQFSSDPHPAHTDNKEMNLQVLSPGQSSSFVVNIQGTWGYHDHLKPSAKGTLIVQ
jgi:plastocyanin